MLLRNSGFPRSLKCCWLVASSLLFVLALLFRLPTAISADITASVGEVKAAYIYNLIHFVQWPTKDHAEWKICLPPKNPLFASLSKLEGKKVADRVIRIHQTADPEQWQECHLLYLPADAGPAQKEQLLSLQKRPVLTITDGEGERVPRTIMFFYKDDEHIRMGIHYPRLKDSGIGISSRLLKILKVRNLQGGLKP